MENKAKYGKRAIVYFKNFFTKNTGVKIAALFFSIVIWGIVLTTQNLPREKSLHHVPVSFVGESDLHARDLVVRGNPLSGLDVTVRASTPITGFKELSTNNISATINLNGVTTPGIKSLPILANVTTRAGGSRVVSTNPENIEVEIDTLMSKRIPVEASYEGALPDGYWAEAAILSDTVIEIRGPRQDVIQVTKAVCKIQMTDRTQNYNDAVNVVVLNADGDEMDGSLFIGGLPAVTVRMSVYAKKTVPVDVMGSLLGSDNLPATYELYAATSTPEKLDLIGDANLLAAIETLKVEGLDIAGKQESIHEKRALLIPEGVSILGDGDGEVEIFVDIREKTSTKTFPAIPIEYTVAKGYKATLNVDATDISVEGRIRLVELLERNDIKAYVDLNGLKEGTHKLYVSVYLGNDETTLEVNYMLSVAQVTVTIKKT